MRGINGGVVPAEVMHRANLAALADRVVTVVGTVDEIPDQAAKPIRVISG